MSTKNQVYKCLVCGQITTILHAASPEIHCCGVPMSLQMENTEDAALEKHVPIIEKTETGVKVILGKVPHPMTEEHFIEWIEVLCDGKSYRQFLAPGDLPEVEFQITGENITARAYCNLHGLWKS
jgi:superoxide reductase